MSPLEGILVIALEHAIAAPFCTRQLADLGARVIKIERPESGDFARHYDSRARGLSSHFVWTNRSKESVTLDLKQLAAKAVLDRLLARADVLVQNLAPGVCSRLGLGYDELKMRHPRLIVCDISGYGASGPYVSRKAYDLLIQSESGFLSITGTPETPSKAGISIADISGGMYAFSGILAALLKRTRTGVGARIEISLLETMVEWMGFPLYYAYDGAEPPVRSGATHATIYPYGPFRSGDGRLVMLGLQNEREWHAFCKTVLEDPDLGHDPRFATNALRSAGRHELSERITSAFLAMSGEQVEERLRSAGIACARVKELSEIWKHPQLAARNRFAEIDTPLGKLAAFCPPGIPDGDQPRMGAVPALGEHTRNVLAELGLLEEEIAELEASGAI